MKHHVELLIAPGNPTAGRKDQEFLDRLEEAGAPALSFHGEKQRDFSLVMIGSGGTERLFQSKISEFSGEIILLSIPAYNSLAASMEILSWLKAEGKKGRILHGSPETIAAEIRTVAMVSRQRAMLLGKKLGVYGVSDWLIASGVDEVRVFEKSGIRFIDLPMEELFEEYEKKSYPENKWTERLKKDPFLREEVEKALWFYGAMKRVVERHELAGVSLRCFDLLGDLKTTGCLALAILNAEGIAAACEGDKKSLLSMLLATSITGEHAFMVNPSFLDPQSGEMIFAHCTLPLDFGEDFHLETHFESGIGVAVAAKCPPKTMTLFKCDDFHSFHLQRVELQDCLSREDLCRTQFRIQLSRKTDYFLKNPIANHHLLLAGDHEEPLRGMMLELGFTERL